MKVSSAIAAFVIIGFGLCARELVAQRIQPAVITQPWVIHESKHDKTNVPLKEMPQIVPGQTRQHPRNRFMKSQPSSARFTPDSAVQTLAASSTITPDLNFGGLGAGFPEVVFSEIRLIPISPWAATR